MRGAMRAHVSGVGEGKAMNNKSIERWRQRMQCHRETQEGLGGFAVAIVCLQNSMTERR